MAIQWQKKWLKSKGFYFVFKLLKKLTPIFLKSQLKVVLHTKSAGSWVINSAELQRAQIEILLSELSITEKFLSFAAKIKLSASMIKRKWRQIISVNTI